MESKRLCISIVLKKDKPFTLKFKVPFGLIILEYGLWIWDFFFHTARYYLINHTTGTDFYDHNAKS